VWLDEVELSLYFGSEYAFDHAMNSLSFASLADIHSVAAGFPVW
jgi:hypothetical protein